MLGGRSVVQGVSSSTCNGQSNVSSGKKARSCQPPPGTADSQPPPTKGGPGPDPRECCWRHNNGGCPFGPKECKWKHLMVKRELHHMLRGPRTPAIGNTGIPGKATAKPKPPSGTGTPSTAPKNPPPSGARKYPVCAFIKTKDGCLHGAGCRYLHVETAADYARVREVRARRAATRVSTASNI